MKRVFQWMPAVVVLAIASQAHAGGYDTPMLYSARHMGMGGTAVGYVRDGSALFHNPAGLANIEVANLTLNFTLLLGGITASPQATVMDAESNLTIAPFPLLGGGARLIDADLGSGMNLGLVVGAAVYPVASAGAVYNYDLVGTPYGDATTLLFIEGSPGVALELTGTPAGDFRIGGGYRFTYVSLSRKQGPTMDGATQLLDFSSKGTNATGFRLGFQWQPIEEIQFGVTYRHRTDTSVTADEGVVIGLAGADIKTEFTLPTRLAFGVRGDYAGFGLAVDLEWVFNSENGTKVVSGWLASETMRVDGCPMGSPEAAIYGSEGNRVCLRNVSNWRDAMTLRVGAEYAIRTQDSDDVNVVRPRLGFVFDDQTSNPMYPTAFGTPPGPTYVFTGGIGFDGGLWEANLAYAYRTGSATITDSDTAACRFCGYNGNYSIGLHGIYLDFSYDFD